MLSKLLSTPTAQLGKASRFAVFQIKLWSHCARLLKKNHSGRQAAALSYHTIFGLVPLAIVMLLIFQSFPAYSDVGEKVKGIVYKELHLNKIKYAPDQDVPEEKVVLTSKLDEIVGGFFEGLNEGRIALFSAVIVIWAALALLSTIEKAFNNIWYVGRGRSFIHRIINYWALLTLGPLLLGMGIYVATRYAAIDDIQKTILSNTAPAVLSYVVSTIAFFLLYFILPNTKVKAKPAIWGAAVAALVWALAKWGFGLYVTEFLPYSRVYGVLGLIPLGVLWIFITWLIVLFGLQLTFTTQHLKTLDAAEIASARTREEYFLANDITVINVVREIAKAFEESEAPIESEVICSRLNMPAEFGEKILNHLVRSEILAKVSEPKIGFVPVKDPANISLADIAGAVSSAGFAQSVIGQPSSVDNIARQQRDNLAKYNLKQILDNANPQQPT
jgi:YihY family inner membrane protein